MLDLKEVDRVAQNAASAVLKRLRVRVFSEQATDSDGRDALRITVVLPRRMTRRVSGDDALDTVVRVRRELREAGEGRLPIIEFATEDELEADADPQP
ncbi:MAG TPA: hypothetical protein VJY39_00905 [Acidisphaera sp.]|nr:hypothetical protein [Acidisphaera sp.]